MWPACRSFLGLRHECAGVGLTSGARADAAAVAGQVQRWLAAASRRAAGGRRTQDLLAGVPRLVAALMQRLSAAVHGASLDVEISYEVDDDVRPRRLPGLPVATAWGRRR